MKPQKGTSTAHGSSDGVLLTLHQ